MGPLIPNGKQLTILLFLLSSSYLHAQSLVCIPFAGTPPVATEGLAERGGDIALNCSGTPAAHFSANLTISLNTNITNHLSSTNTPDIGVAGPPAAALTVASAQLTGTNAVTFNGINFTMPPSGNAVL